MGNKFHQMIDPLSPIELDKLASSVGYIGDLLYWDASNNVARSFADWTEGASEAIDQAALAPLFLGMAVSQWRSTDDSTLKARFLPECYVLMTCVSSAFDVGDLVGPTWNGGSAVVSQVVKKVTDPALAIGTVVAQYTSATTEVWVRLKSRMIEPTYQGEGLPDQILGSTTVAADVLAIPVTHRYVEKTTGADAEALTLADGQRNQILTISLAVDGGGTGTLTPTTKSGFVSIAFADAGDTATLMFVDAATGWIILGTAGVAAPPAIAIT